MSRELERQVLATDFKQLAEPEFGANIAFPNIAFETPLDAMFAVFDIVNRGAVRRSLGSSIYVKRNMGTVQVDIYTPKNEGTARSRQLTDAWEFRYDSVVISLGDGESCVFQTPFSHALAANRIRAGNLDDNWDRYVFEAPFYRDQFVEK